MILGKFSLRKDTSVLPVMLSQLVTCSHLINYLDRNVYLKRDSKRTGFKTLLCSGLLSQESEILQQHGHSPSEFSLDCIASELLLQKQHCNFSILTTAKSPGSEVTGILWAWHCLGNCIYWFPHLACCRSWCVMNSATEKALFRTPITQVLS